MNKSKRIIRVTVAVAGIFIILVTAHLCYLQSMTAAETYPADNYLSSVSRKKALIVTAHDDDAYSFSGTIFKLVADGWDISQVCFRRTDDERNQLFYKVTNRQGLTNTILLSMPYRKDTSYNAWLPFPVERFPEVFNIDTVYNALATLIDSLQPSVIFSLDDSIGGYGHPDHVFISKQVINYCNNNKARPGFPVQKVYQAVFPPSMARSILLKNTTSDINLYKMGQQQYHCTGMPLPDVSVNIYPYARQKKTYMNGFSAHDRKNISKISPWYNWYPSWVYFRIFNKEYFRIVDTGKQ
ncbi:MAG: PIG-L family deacetylase [Chitinophagaceae bacterium]